MRAGKWLAWIQFKLLMMSANTSAVIASSAIAGSSPPFRKRLSKGVEVDDWLIPVAVFILGQLSAIMLTWLQARWRSNQERGARAEERRERLRERHNETLVRLQESLYTLGFQSYFLAQVRWESAEHGRYDESERLEVFAHAGMLRVRVMDAEVRRLAQEVRDAANGVFKAKSLSDAQDALREQHGAYEQANERIGRLLRGELDPLAFGES